MGFILPYLTMYMTVLKFDKFRTAAIKLICINQSGVMPRLLPFQQLHYDRIIMLPCCNINTLYHPSPRGVCKRLIIQAFSLVITQVST